MAAVDMQSLALSPAVEQVTVQVSTRIGGGVPSVEPLTIAWRERGGVAPSGSIDAPLAAALGAPSTLRLVNSDLSPGWGDKMEVSVSGSGRLNFRNFSIVESGRFLPPVMGWPEMRVGANIPDGTAGCTPFIVTHALLMFPGAIISHTATGATTSLEFHDRSLSV